MFVHTGEDACQEIPHIHFHIVPRRRIQKDGREATTGGYFPHIPPLPHPNTKPNDTNILMNAHKNPIPADEYRVARANINGEDAEELAADMREKVAEEFARVKAKEGVDLEKVGWKKLRPSVKKLLKRKR